MNYVGLDLSFTSSGFVILDDKCKITHQEIIKTKPKDGDKDERIFFIKNEIKYVLSKFKNDDILCYIEGPILNVRGTKISGNAFVDMGGLNFCIRILMLEMEIEYKIIPPKTLTKFITGNGNSNKKERIFMCGEKWKYVNKNDNLVDAYGLSRMAFEENKK